RPIEGDRGDRGPLGHPAHPKRLPARLPARQAGGGRQDERSADRGDGEGRQEPFCHWFCHYGASWEGKLARKCLILWSHPPGSNRRPADYESAALPAELGWPFLLIIYHGSRTHLGLDKQCPFPRR